MNRQDTVRASLVVLALMVLSGCATMNEEECLTADWYGLGYEDGAQGRPAEFISNRREACAKHGITPDLNAYNDGRAEGLAQFCTPARGFSFGREGNTYQGVCAGNGEEEFLIAFRAGRELGSLEDELARAKSELDRAKNVIEDRAKRLEEGRRKILFFNDETPIEERKKLLDDMERWEEELDEATSSIDRLADDVIALEIEVRAAQDASPYR